jgi:hypothetical protein
MYSTHIQKYLDISVQYSFHPPPHPIKPYIAGSENLSFLSVSNIGMDTSMDGN